MPDIIFPNVGIEIEKINSVAFTIFGKDIYWYGIIIVCGIILGLLLVIKLAKSTDQNPELYMDFVMYALIFSILCARLYYVIFSWDEYKSNIIKVFAFREGGLAIYGGVIGAVITLIVYSKKKKLDFWLMADTAAPGLILGQAIGRWGNFMNMEAFGGQTNNLFAMCIKTTKAKIPENLNVVPEVINGASYLKVHPTFFYESIWSIGVLILLLIYFKKKKFHGEIFFLYLLGYGLGRVWIEGLRTDQLIIANTGIPVSQLLAAILIIIAIINIYIRRKITKKNSV